MSGWGLGTRPERGAAAVETALCLCFVVLPVVFGTISYAYMLSFRQTLSQAATEGARAAAVRVVLGTVAEKQIARTATARAAVAQAMHTGPRAMSCGAEHLECAVEFPACPDVAAGDCVKVTVAYPYRDHALMPTVPGLGFTLPSSLSYSATAGVS